MQIVFYQQKLVDMKKYVLFLISALLISLGSFATPGHGCHGSHSSHGGGHSFGFGHSSSHYHSSYHYHSHHYSRDRSNNYNSYNYNRNTRNGAPRYSLSQVHEFNVGLGSLTYMDGVDSNKCYCATKPAFNFSYKYFLSRTIGIGIGGSIQSLGGNNIVTGSEPSYNFTAMNTTVAADMTIIYLSQKYVQLYGSVAVGVSHYTETDVYANNTSQTIEKNVAAVQVSPLGLRVGGALGLFAELGYGYRGIISGGLSIHIR